MQEPSSPGISIRRLERALAVTGTALCLIISAGAWWGLRVQQSLWPLPDLYLLEMLAVSALATWGIWSQAERPASMRLILTWASIGIMLGFMILGAFTIGFFYLPVVVLLVQRGHPGRPPCAGPGWKGQAGLQLFYSYGCVYRRGRRAGRADVGGHKNNGSLGRAVLYLPIRTGVLPAFDLPACTACAA